MGKTHSTLSHRGHISVMNNKLTVVTYHYVRDLPNSRFPRIKGMLTTDFRSQVALLSERYEMATLDSALAFVAGKYQPKRDICLLTFDDGFKEHYNDVLPILAERHIQGLFFVITSCLEEQRVVSVHKNHFLMAGLDFEEYRQKFLSYLTQLNPEMDTSVDTVQARRKYRWDTPEAAVFKYLVNYLCPDVLRDQILDAIFVEYLGEEAEFARQLYMSWDEAKEMQAAGMLIGGHSNGHMVMSTLDNSRQREDLETSTGLLHSRLNSQNLWPFCYPYGTAYTFNSITIQILRSLGYVCSFTTENGVNEVGQDTFNIHRTDTNDVRL